jgi:hypothetical protein
VRATYQPKSNRRWLTDEEVARIENVAGKMGLEYEIIFALITDIRLWSGANLCRLTVKNAQDAVLQRWVMIKGKRRHGGKTARVFSLVCCEFLGRYLAARQELVRSYGADPLSSSSGWPGGERRRAS